MLAAEGKQGRLRGVLLLTGKAPSCSVVTSAGIERDYLLHVDGGSLGESAGLED